MSELHLNLGDNTITVDGNTLPLGDIWIDESDGVTVTETLDTGGLPDTLHKYADTIRAVRLTLVTKGTVKITQ